LIFLNLRNARLARPLRLLLVNAPTMRADGR